MEILIISCIFGKSFKKIYPAPIEYISKGIPLTNCNQNCDDINANGVNGVKCLFFTNNPELKQEIMNVTGPDAFSRAIYHYNSKYKQILHRHIDYNIYFIRAGVSNYKKMYTKNGEKHYSEYKEKLYV